MANTDSYCIVGVFERFRSEDDDICAETGRTPIAQLAAELQEAYDDGHIAGLFQLVQLVPGESLMAAAKEVALRLEV